MRSATYIEEPTGKLLTPPNKLANNRKWWARNKDRYAGEDRRDPDKESITVWETSSQKARLERCAAKLGMSLAAFVRLACDDKAAELERG
jgi:hypothetical protein